MSRTGFVCWWLGSLAFMLYAPLLIFLCGAILLLGMPIYSHLIRDHHVDIKPHTDLHELTMMYRVTLLTLLKGAIYTGKTKGPNNTKLMERI